MDDTRLLYRTAIPLSVAGYDVRLVARAPSHDFRFPKQDRLSSKVLPVGSPGLTGRIRYSYRALRTAIDEYAPDVVHFHDPELVVATGPLRLALWASGSARPLIVFDAHEMLAEQLLMKPQLRGVSRAVMSALVRRVWPRFVRLSVDHIVAAEDDIASWMVAGRDLTVVRNTVDTELFAGLDDLAVDDDTVRVIYVGGTTIERGIATLIEAGSLLSETRSIEITIVGSGQLSKQDMAALAARFSSPQTVVRVRGRLTFLEAIDEMGRADIGVIPFHDVPKYRLSVPTKAWEYLAAGLATVGSDLPPIREILQQKPYSVLAPPGDASSLAAAIDGLAERLPPSHLRKGIVRESLGVDDCFEGDRGRLLALYRDVVGTHSSDTSSGRLQRHAEGRR